MNASTSVKPNKPVETASGLRLWAIKSMVYVVVLAAILCLSAGRLNWTAGWVYVGLVAVVQVIDVLALPHELLAERSQLREGTKKWDVVLASAMAIWLPLLTMIVAGLDERFSWSPDIVSWLTVAGVIVALAGALFTVWAMRVNAYFSGTVRIQSERGHQVASSGPYRLMRHPGYVGMLVYYLVVPLILGSLWAYIPVALFIAVTFIRTALEDKTLQAELPGYREYAQTVRYRLLPGVW